MPHKDYNINHISIRYWTLNKKEKEEEEERDGEKEHLRINLHIDAKHYPTIKVQYSNIPSKLK